MTENGKECICNFQGVACSTNPTSPGCYCPDGMYTNSDTGLCVLNSECHRK